MKSLPVFALATCVLLSACGGTVYDPRGVEKSVQPGDYAGRYLLLEFWGHG